MSERAKAAIKATCCRLSVLHVIPSLSPLYGGPSAALGVIERALLASDVRVETATTDDDGPRGPAGRPAVTFEGGVVRRWFRRTTRTYTYAAGFTPWLRRHVRDYDLIHVHAVFSHLPMAAAREALKHDVPYVVQPHGMLLDYSLSRSRLKKAVSLPLIEAPLLRAAAAVHVTSAAEYEELIRRFGTNIRLAVIPLGVQPTPPGSAVRFRERFPQLRESGPVLLFLSRIDPKKNLETLIDALARLDGGAAPVRLVVCGSGDDAYVTGLKQRAVERGVDDRILWTGFVEGETKADALAAADLFVLPSFSENFGVAPVEALLAGVPCVLGEGVAIADDVEAAGAGRAVAPTADAVASAVREMLGADLAGAYRQAARRLARERYAPDVMGQKLVALYERILA